MAKESTLSEISLHLWSRYRADEARLEYGRQADVTHTETDLFIFYSEQPPQAFFKSVFLGKTCLQSRVSEEYVSYIDQNTLSNQKNRNAADKHLSV